ncbi:MAG: TraR/DksA C4-type zinc finger protein [Ferruginibacter sp.]|nr:TraR/DksA C4-type zinc finger protein [Ferruginibacter sp.]
MATKKHVPVKAGRAAAKPVAKNLAKAVKPVTKKAVKKAAPAKKAAPKKVVFKPVAKKIVKPALKKAVTKHAPKKGAGKPVRGQITKPAAKSVKPLAKTTPKKVAEAKKPITPVAKATTKKAVLVKNIPIKAVNQAQKIMAKKEDIKNPAATPAAEKAVSPKHTVEVKAKEIKVPAPKPVVIPKISTKTVRKYQPEFTKSVLDKAQRDPGAPSQRYSDAELQEFRDLIQRKLEAAKKELSYLHGLITRKDEMGGDEGDNRYMTMEDGSLSMEREQLSQMASRQITFIDHLEKAVMRIENKTYGICRVTGKLIDKARLRAVPHATLSIEAKMGSGR